MKTSACLTTAIAAASVLVACSSQSPPRPSVQPAPLDVDAAAELVALAARDRFCVEVARPKYFPTDAYRTCMEERRDTTYCDATAADLSDLIELMQVDPSLAAVAAVDEVSEYIAGTCHTAPLRARRRMFSVAPRTCETYMPILVAQRIAISIGPKRTDSSTMQRQACSGNLGQNLMTDECRAAQISVRRQRSRPDQLPKYLRYFCRSLFADSGH